MSHNAERKEKNCLNCAAQVQGRFCQVCGQENIETKESFLALAKHFIYDVFHFDGKFFYTLKYIFTKPGFVARQYAEGKRASYLHPIRMYLFTSAVFFVVFFASNPVKVRTTYGDVIGYAERAALLKKYEKKIKANPGDSVIKSRIALLLDTTKPLNIDSLGWAKEDNKIVSFEDKNYSSVQQYDSAQEALPAAQRDGWLMNSFTKQSIKTNKKYGNNAEGITAFFETFLHKVPYMLFVSLPFFALILKLLYVRRKNFYYSDHAVFTLYHYILTFLLLLIVYALHEVNAKLHWGLISFLQVMVGFTWPVYLFLELKNFYRQGVGKTIGKFILLNLLGFIFILFLFILFLLISFFQS